MTNLRTGCVVILFLKQCSDLSGGLVGAFDVACVVTFFLRQFAELELEGGPLVLGHGPSAMKG